MGAKILVADDSKTIQTAVELTFTGKEVELIPAGNGEEAIEKAKESHPDLMLIDAVMPDQSGYEVCRALKAERALRDVPIIILTGPSDVADAADRKAAGASDVIIKPFEARELISTVRRHLDGESHAPSAPPDNRLELTPLLERFDTQRIESAKPPALEQAGAPAALVNPTAPAPSSSDRPVPVFPLEERANVAASSSVQSQGEIPSQLIEEAATRAAEQAFARIEDELRATLTERIERSVREIVPALAEQLILKEIEQIKASIEGHATE